MVHARCEPLTEFSPSGVRSSQVLLTHAGREGRVTSPGGGAPRSSNRT